MQEPGCRGQDARHTEQVPLGVSNRQRDGDARIYMYENRTAR